MKIFDTLSGENKGVEKTNKTINLFVCGPTVYDYAHLGHARTYLFFDIAVKYLRSQGYDIFYLQNITDIDDKIIKRATEAGSSAKEIADKFTNEYLKDMRDLGIDSVSRYAPATDFIPEIVDQVKALIEKDYAYKISDGYYFDISKFKGYGKLSHRSVEGAEQSVSRIDESIEKRNKGDFCLWKFSREGEPSWDTELGHGRPGWHIEDTAISNKYFGPQYDIHGGGLDLKFPHHEAEIAQQESISGKEPFVGVWMHTGMLFIDGVKMSKSLNNFVTIKDFLSEHDKDVFRMIVLMHHYRSNINYTKDLLKQADNSLSTIKETLDKLKFVVRKSKKENSTEEITNLIEETEKEFNDALNNDFNTPKAIASIFMFINKINKSIWTMNHMDALTSISFISGVLNNFGLKVAPEDIPVKINMILTKIDKFRGNKQFIQSDALRKELEGLGYKVEDTPLGSFARKIQ